MRLGAATGPVPSAGICLDPMACAVPGVRRADRSRDGRADGCCRIAWGLALLLSAHAGDARCRKMAPAGPHPGRQLSLMGLVLHPVVVCASFAFDGARRLTGRDTPVCRLPAITRRPNRPARLPRHRQLRRLRSPDHRRGSSIGYDASLPGYTVQNGRLHVGLITIGAGCFVARGRRFIWTPSWRRIPRSAT